MGVRVWGGEVRLSDRQYEHPYSKNVLGPIFSAGPMGTTDTVFESFNDILGAGEVRFSLE